MKTSKPSHRPRDGILAVTTDQPGHPPEPNQKWIAAYVLVLVIVFVTISIMVWTCWRQKVRRRNKDADVERQQGERLNRRMFPWRYDANVAEPQRGSNIWPTMPWSGRVNHDPSPPPLAEPGAAVTRQNILGRFAMRVGSKKEKSQTHVGSTHVATAIPLSSRPTKAGDLTSTILEPIAEDERSGTPRPGRHQEVIKPLASKKALVQGIINPFTNKPFGSYTPARDDPRGEQSTAHDQGGYGNLGPPPATRPVGGYGNLGPAPETRPGGGYGNLGPAPEPGKRPSTAGKTAEHKHPSVANNRPSGIDETSQAHGYGSRRPRDADNSSSQATSSSSSKRPAPAVPSSRYSAAHKPDPRAPVGPRQRLPSMTGSTNADAKPGDEKPLGPRPPVPGGPSYGPCGLDRDVIRNMKRPSPAEAVANAKMRTSGADGGGLPLLGPYGRHHDKKDEDKKGGGFFGMGGSK